MHDFSPFSHFNGNGIQQITNGSSEFLAVGGSGVFILFEN